MSIATAQTIAKILDKVKEDYLNLLEKLYDYRENDLKVILDAIERGAYKDQKSVLFDVVLQFDIKFFADKQKEAKK